ncbi:MAG: transposase [Proteobacteria bacterium]|nr:transposase [Pseudomonadota bacterium]
MQTIVRSLGQDLNQQAKEVWAHGRVLVVDGSGFSMPDTKSNAKKFIRHGENTHGKANKKSGVAFPIGRIVAVYIVTELKKTSQWRINPKLDDQIIEIERPRWRDQSCSISLPEHEALPEKIEVRVIKITCAPKGFRPKTKFILTTHTDSKKVPKADLADLYRKRWQVELNFRSIKTILGMDVVRSTSEEMVVKEVWVHMLAYNLVRETMCVVAATKRCLTSEVSFRATQQIMSVWRLVNAVRGKRLHQSEMIEILMTQSLVGQRPDRYEPRAIKRRQKSYRLLIHSRAVAKTMLHKKSKK